MKHLKDKQLTETTERALLATTLLHRFTQPIYETAAFKLGIIDGEGNVLKIPATVEERAALTPIDYYCLKLRKFIGESKLELLNTSLLLDSLSKTSESTNTEGFDQALYEKEIYIQSKLNNLILDYKDIAREAYESNIALGTLENYLFEAIVNAQKH